MELNRKLIYDCRKTIKIRRNIRRNSRIIKQNIRNLMGYSWKHMVGMIGKSWKPKEKPWNKKGNS